MAQAEGRILWTYFDLWKWLSEHDNVALTHGVFDLFHEGHRRYIEFAATCGTHLLVSVDSDAFTKIRKGVERPVHNALRRMEDSLTLPCVTAVTTHVYHFHLLSFVRPTHYIISTSSGPIEKYAIEIAFVKSYGGIVHIKDEMADIHTTDLVREMRIAQAKKAEAL